MASPTHPDIGKDLQHVLRVPALDGVEDVEASVGLQDVQKPVRLVPGVSQVQKVKTDPVVEGAQHLEGSRPWW